MRRRTGAAFVPGWVNLLVAIGTVVVSFVVGGYLGKKLRMPDHGWKIGLCLFTLLASVAILLLGPPLKLGIDLSGGAILVYEVDQSKKATPETLNSQRWTISSRPWAGASIPAARRK